MKNIPEISAHVQAVKIENLVNDLLHHYRGDFDGMQYYNYVGDVEEVLKCIEDLKLAIIRDTVESFVQGACEEQLPKLHTDNTSQE